MKKYLLSFLLIVPALAGAQQGIPFTLKGTIGRVDAPAKVYLLQDGKFDHSATLHNGVFELKGSMDAPASSMLILARSGNLNDALTAPRIDRTFFFLEPGPVVFTSADSLQNAKVTGNPLGVEYDKLWGSLRNISEQLGDVRRQKQAAIDQPDASPALIERLERQEVAITRRRNQPLIAYIKEHPDSFVSLDALQKVGGDVPLYAEVGPLYDALTPRIRTSPTGQKYGELLQVIKTASSTTASLDNLKIGQAVAEYQEKRQQTAEELRRKQLKAYIKAHPDAQESLAAMQQLYGPVVNYTEAVPLFNSLSAAVRNSAEGKKYYALLESRWDVAVGKSAPLFTQLTPEGKPVSLADYRGKYVLVDFWASWCGPCRAENPNLTKTYNEYKDKNFDILSVSLDDEKARAKWLKAIAADQLAWTQVSDLKGWQSQAAILYHIEAIPQNFLIDPAGKIVAVNLRGDELRAALARFIK